MMKKDVKQFNDGFTNFFGRLFRSRSSGIDSMSRTSSLYSRKFYYPEDHEIVDFSIDDSRLSCPEFNLTVKEETEEQNRLSAPSRLPARIQSEESIPTDEITTAVNNSRKVDYFETATKLEQPLKQRSKSESYSVYVRRMRDRGGAKETKRIIKEGMVAAQRRKLLSLSSSTKSSSDTQETSQRWRTSEPLNTDRLSQMFEEDISELEEIEWNVSDDASHDTVVTLSQTSGDTIMDM